jgi:hypothetical protein
MQEQKIRRNVPRCSRKVINGFIRPTAAVVQELLEGASGNLAADYSLASMEWPRVSFYNHSAVAMANSRFAGRDRDEHLTCLVTCWSVVDSNNGGDPCRSVLNGFSLLSIPR